MATSCADSLRSSRRRQPKCGARSTSSRIVTRRASRRARRQVRERRRHRGVLPSRSGPSKIALCTRPRLRSVTAMHGRASASGNETAVSTLSGSGTTCAPESSEAVSVSPGSRCQAVPPGHPKAACRTKPPSSVRAKTATDVRPRACARSSATRSPKSARRSRSDSRMRSRATAAA